MAVLDYVLTFDTITVFRTSAIPTDVDKIFIRGYYAATGNGGGYLVRSSTAQAIDVDDVLVFRNKAPMLSAFYWERDLQGVALDAYMAGALGGARLTENGEIAPGSIDDSARIKALLATLAVYAYARTSSIPLRVAIGQGVFYVADTLYLTGFPNGTRGWEIDGTGATVLGACPDKPVLDLTDCRFGTVPNLQIIGVTQAVGSDYKPISSCGIRIGRKADNGAANQMTMDHVGIRGQFKIAALLNVASEQHTSIVCEYINEAEGNVYAYFADAFNCAQWGKPVKIDTWSLPAGGAYTVTTTSDHQLTNGDKILIRDQSPANAAVDGALLMVSNVSGRSFTITPSTGVIFSGGELYKQLYTGAIETELLAPWTQASFKQQLHLDCRYGCPNGTAAIFEGTDSMHVYQACHPTGGYYSSGLELTIQSIVPGTTTPGTAVTTTTAHSLSDDMLVSLTKIGTMTPGNVPTSYAAAVKDRLFRVTVTSTTSFLLRDLDGTPVISADWGAQPSDLGKVTRQKVADGDDPTAGGFGMRMVVSASGCDTSDYLMHHEPGIGSQTTWWASIDSMEGLRGDGPAPVTRVVMDRCPAIDIPQLGVARRA